MFFQRMRREIPSQSLCTWNQSASLNPMKSINLKDLHSAVAKISSNDLILDVRTPAEFSEGHIPGAKNIPVDQVVTRIQDLKNFKTIYVYCKAGGRATVACNVLESMGIQNLVCYDDGGFPDWKEEGYSFE